MLGKEKKVLNLSPPNALIGGPEGPYKNWVGRETSGFRQKACGNDSSSNFIKMPIKILHISSATTWRGGEAQVEFLCRGLSGEGVEQKLCLPSPHAPLAQKCNYISQIYLGGSPLGFLKLKNAVKEFSPDILHCHDAKAHSWAVIFLFRGLSSYFGYKASQFSSKRRVVFQI